MSQALQRLLETLARSAARPLESATAMPPAAFADPDFLELELEKVIATEWHCLGRANDLTKPGDYLTAEIAGESVFVILNQQGQHRAFANVCQHRLARLLSGRGRVQRIVCPYHAWNYDLEGQLKAASFMRPDFDPGSICLPRLGLEVWEGWLYVNLDRNAAPLAPRLTGLQETLKNFRMATFEPLFRREEVWPTNWKVLLENFNESYHLFHVHAQTVEPALPTRLTRHDDDGGEGYSLLYQERLPDVAYEYGAEMEIKNLALSEDEKLLHPLYCVFPTHAVALSPERAFWISLQPLGSDQVKVLWGADAYPGAFPAGEEGEERIAALAKTLEAINEEDLDIIEAVRRNAESRFATSGPLSPKEKSLWLFQRYLAKRLGIWDGNP